MDNETVSNTEQKTCTDIKSKVRGKIVFLILIICILVGLIFAKKMVYDIAYDLGNTAGKLIGSYNGVTDGIAEGSRQGKEAGLSAEDTEVDVGNKVKGIGKLEVLSASVVMHDVNEIKDKYKTIIAFYGDITFTVDLYDADVTKNGDVYNVVLPVPDSTLRLDDSKSEQIASYMKHSWSGSEKDGYTEALNSVKKLIIRAEDTVSNYDELKECAMDSAEKQVAFLIQSVTSEEVTVNVSFKE